MVWETTMVIVDAQRMVGTSSIFDKERPFLFDDERQHSLKVEYVEF